MKRLQEEQNMRKYTPVLGIQRRFRLDIRGWYGAMAKWPLRIPNFFDEFMNIVLPAVVLLLGFFIVLVIFPHTNKYRLQNNNKQQKKTEKDENCLFKLLFLLKINLELFIIWMKKEEKETEKWHGSSCVIVYNILS